MSSSFFKPFIFQNDNQVTIQLKPLLPETRTRHLRAFLEVLMRPSRRDSLLCKILAHPLQMILVYLLFANSAVKTLDQCLKLAAGLILIIILPTYLYETLLLPNDYTLILSTITGQMFVTRFGFRQPSLILSLTKIIDFRPAIRTKTTGGSDAFPAHVIQVNTTDHPILLGDSSTSYQFFTPILNNFLQRHREQGHIPPAQVLLPSSENPPVTISTPAPDDVPAFMSVDLTFRRVTPTSFEIVKQNKFDELNVFNSVMMRFLFDYTPFRFIYQRGPSPPPCAPFGLKWYIPCQIISSMPIALATYAWVKRPSPTWVVTGSLVDISSPRRLFYYLINRRYVPIASDYKVSITPYEHRAHSKSNSTTHSNLHVSTTLYTINFSAAGRVVRSVNGFSHDETICILAWLREYFPHLFPSDCAMGGQDTREADPVQYIPEDSSQPR